MTGKSKESVQKENIKLGIIAVVTILIIVFSVTLTIEKTINYNAFVPISFTTKANFKGLCLTAFPDINQPQQECMREGYNQCRELNPIWEYSTSKIDICYKQCMWDVRNICNWANAKYPNYKR